MLDKIYGDTPPNEPGDWSPTPEFTAYLGGNTPEEFAKKGIDEFTSEPGYLDLVFDSARETLANRNRSNARKNRSADTATE